MPSNRRSFLMSSAAATALRGAPGDKIRVAMIGAGGRGRDHFNMVRSSGENVTIAAVCDVWKVNREAMAANVEKEFGAAPKQTTRYQDVLAMEDIDAVLIATPDVTHPKILADAVAAGKDVYVEKPFAVEIADARMAYKAVKASRQVVQVGTQRRSDPGLMAAAKLIQTGAIGKVTRVSMEYHFQEPRWRRDYHMIKAEDIDWEAFQFGGRMKGPFDARKFREWQLFSDATSGIAGLWLCHFSDMMAWYLNDPYPQGVMSMGGVYLWKDGRETSDVFQSMLEYKDCLVTFAMSLTNSAGNRHLWFGTKGVLDPEALKVTGDGSKDPDRVMQPYDIRKLEGVESHMANFLRCMRTRGTPRAPVEAGFSHAVAGCMAAVSLQTGRKTKFNRETLEIV
ncbi:MAG: Gfo/Idh/MocA family oxidoreductase [Acidobacteria bacterium]|nr:Gfo/Idh/MocA family oxidoreductase [Acidobacteriota bacterium]